MASRERDALFELTGVHGMAELNRGDQLLQVGIVRVLVELAFRDLGGERLAAEVEAVTLEQDPPGEEPFLAKRTVKAPVHRPVILRRECSSLSLTQSQAPAILGESSMPAGDGLLHLLQRRGGLVEIHRQRLDGRDALVVVFGEYRER